MNSSDFWQLSKQFGSAANAAERDRLQSQALQKLGMDSVNFYQELQMSSQYFQTHRDVTRERRDVALHSHSFYEILCCCSSCGVEYLVGTERYRLQKGDIVIVPPGVSHRPIFPDVLPEPYSRYLLWVSQEFAKRFEFRYPGFQFQDAMKGILLRTAGTRWEYLEELFRTGVEETEAHNPYWEMAVFGNSINLLIHLIRASQSSSTGTMKAEAPGLADQIISYVEEHLAEKITLSDMAKACFVSESTISQTFRRKMGVSFYRWVTQRRLIAAKDLITRGIPLETISEQVGFADYSSFYRAFRQEFGISPRQYRSALNLK